MEIQKIDGSLRMAELPCLQRQLLATKWNNHLLIIFT